MSSIPFSKQWNRLTKFLKWIALLPLLFLISFNTALTQEDAALDIKTDISGKDSIIPFPEAFEITYLTVKEKGKSSVKYYLIDVNNDFITLLPLIVFDNTYPGKISKKQLVEIPFDNLEYVKPKKRYSFQREEIEVNSYLMKTRSKKFRHSFFKTVGAFTGLGLSFDLMLYVIGIPAFPAATIAYGVIGIALGLVAPGLQYIIDNSGEKGRFYAKHVRQEEILKFKYYFKYSDRKFIIQVLDELKMTSLIQ